MKQLIMKCNPLWFFLDAIYLALRQGMNEKEGVLCAYGLLENGGKGALAPSFGQLGI